MAAYDEKAGVTGDFCKFGVDGGGSWWDPKGILIARPPQRSK